MLKNKTRAINALLDGMSRTGAVTIDSREVAPNATCMMVLTSWLRFKYTLDPCNALEPANAQSTLLRSTHHVLNLLRYPEQGSMRTFKLWLSSISARPAEKQTRVAIRRIQQRKLPTWPHGLLFLTLAITLLTWSA